MPRILIIGAGLTGACLAFRLARAGASVTLIEAAQPAAAASGASFGWINASFFHSPAHFNLRAAGIEAHRRLDRDLPGPALTRWSGTLWWEEEGHGMDRQEATLRALGYPVARLTAARIAALEPAAAAPPECLHFPSEGAVDAAALTRRLIEASGAEVWTGCPVAAIETNGGRVSGLRVPGGAASGDHVILAAGTGAAALLAPLGLSLPMLARPGAILRTRPVGVRLGHILAAPDQEVRQDTAGRLIAPLSAAHQGDVSEGFTEPPGELARQALERLGKLVPGVRLEMQELALANRPVPGDGLPVLGETAVEGLSLAVMHSGVTLGPLVGEVLAREVLGGAKESLLTEFRPGRFSL